MKKISIMVVFLLAAVALTGCESATSSTDNRLNGSDKPAATKSTKVANNQPMSSIETAADKVQVFLFHATQRCTTCTAIGKLAGETVNERFKDELESGKIEFKEVNIDLPENKELARKFQASGSALYLNSIKDGVDSIEQDTKVWRLTGDPSAFKDYLEGRLNFLLGQ